jgi:Domain of unknown function (DUF4345)
MKVGVSISSKIYVGFSILSLAYVSFLSIGNPQATMDLVKVNLPNNDAISSIRGIYGGSGLAIIISLSYLFFKNIRYALQFLTLFWGFYAASRLITILVDGPLGSFGNQWIIIESSLFVIGVILSFSSLSKKPYNV